MSDEAEIAAGYDALHRAAEESPLLAELYVEAWGGTYPVEVAPTSSCTWELLGRLVGVFGPAAGGVLVDLGCGRGGPGLWLARALPARVVGVDVSPLAVRLASGRAAAFVPSGRAEFRVGTFEDTGLDDGSADAVLSVDALPFAPDHAAAVREIRRILRPGGRLAFTAARPVDWPAILAGAGLDAVEEWPHEGTTDRWLALYRLVERHADTLREQLDPLAARNLFAEAGFGLRDGLADRRPRLIVARRPGEVGQGPR